MKPSEVIRRARISPNKAAGYKRWRDSEFGERRSDQPEEIAGEWVWRAFQAGWNAAFDALAIALAEQEESG